MDSSGFLGNELELEEDPFISGTLPTQQNDHFLNDIYGESSLFDQDLLLGEDNQFNKESESATFNDYDPSSYNLGMQDMNGIFGFNVYNNFNFDDEEETVVEHVSVSSPFAANMKALDTTRTGNEQDSTHKKPEQLEQRDVKFGTLLHGKQNINESIEHQSEMDARHSVDVTNENLKEIVRSYSQQSTSYGSTSHINANKNQNTVHTSRSLPTNSIISKVQAVSKHQQVSNVHAIPTTPFGTQQHSFNHKALINNKPKALFPVKVSKIIPQYNRTMISRKVMNKKFNPYALGPPYQKNKQPSPHHSALNTQLIPDTENLPMKAQLPSRRPTAQQELNVNGVDEYLLNERNKEISGPIRVTPKKLKMSTLVPRDVASNHIKCAMCHGSFTTQLALEFHEVERHPHAYVFKCNICNDMFASINMINKHITEDHKKEMIPLLDSSIFGNGLEIDMGRKTSQRRISGMIWNFLSNHLSLSGKLTGTIKDSDTIRKEAKALLNSSLAKHIWSDLESSGPLISDSPLKRVCIEENSSINDLLKQAYIYGPSISRVSINSVPMYKVIRGIKLGSIVDKMQNRYFKRISSSASDCDNIQIKRTVGHCQEQNMQSYSTYVGSPRKIFNPSSNRKKANSSIRKFDANINTGPTCFSETTENIAHKNATSDVTRTRLTNDQKDGLS